MRKVSVIGGVPVEEFDVGPERAQVESLYEVARKASRAKTAREVLLEVLGGPSYAENFMRQLQGAEPELGPLAKMSGEAKVVTRIFDELERIIEEGEDAQSQMKGMQ